MAQAQFAQTLPSAEPFHDRGERREVLFKADRPRTIDQYIDYFGGTSRTQVPAGDPCGDHLLDTVQ
jgi:hypothetical protein